ncbi:MAG: GvpL/GvpF family gas vesicle protein [Chloroherpetonaceae bacterium]
MLTYLYCVAEPHSKVLPEKVKEVEFEGLAAIVAEVSEEEFGEENLKKNLSRLEWVEATVRHHESVMEAMRVQSSIVPFRFPTLFLSQNSLQEFLQAHKESLKHLLETLKGKEEWGIKAYIGSEQLQAFLAESKEIQEIDEALKTASAGKAYLLKKKRESLAGQNVSASLQEALELLYERLREKAVQHKRNPVLPKALTEREDEMILNAAFLIEATAREQFLEEVESLKKTFAYLTLEVSGAWAAYNFCNLKQEHK